ncbi:hypothetical protein [Leadbettera azotonutricia]|uniref:Uncharacterized protein n=1 Tax=Leadbettera azotonutricia (strain ATCC BAA-888 / DSM 13862 / ZAS-9) TaxID=545695 RepID=F5YG09_LEAAZ|nr:hypothetical protein [Leadbettera azotonutricia]AEF81489.1 hypothetical protein TREAZ_1298 [Leadbettera azotonutricia ZAS-9]
MKRIIAAVLLAGALSVLGAAEFTVPRLEMATRGRVEDGDFVLSSAISADLSLTGGYKYGILLGFDFATLDLMDPAAGPFSALNFRIAKARARDLFDLPLELTYFLGAGDDFCSGDEFSDRFGIAPIGTTYRGFFYFPEGIGGDINRRYNGIHSARGTGLSVALTKWGNVVPMFYLYEDFTYNFLGSNQFTPTFDNGEIHYSGDFRVLINNENTKIEFFGGSSLTSDLDVNLRAGVLAHFSSNKGMEFLLQGGIPGWDADSKFGIDNLFFLMEPRLRFEKGGLNVTFFYHPVEYLHIKTAEEKGKVDLNIRFYLGRPETGFSGGLETTMGLKIDGMDDFSLFISPFLSFAASGLLWDAKIRVNILDFDPPTEAFELFIGVRTAF